MKKKKEKKKKKNRGRRRRGTEEEEEEEEHMAQLRHAGCGFAEGRVPLCTQKAYTGQRRSIYACMSLPHSPLSLDIFTNFACVSSIASYIPTALAQESPAFVQVELPAMMIDASIAFAFGCLVGAIYWTGTGKTRRQRRREVATTWLTLLLLLLRMTIMVASVRPLLQFPFLASIFALMLYDDWMCRVFYEIRRLPA